MELGYQVNLKRVGRLMRPAGIQGLWRRRYRGCTVRNPTAAPSVDLVERNFTITDPDALWSPTSPNGDSGRTALHEVARSAPER